MAIQDDDRIIFNARPPSGRRIINVRSNYTSILCSTCQQQFKDYLRHGGIRPKACDVCAEKLKNKMYEGRYPDRSQQKNNLEQEKDS
jgi:predicted amidophosphoribosyltransferase